MTAEAFVRVKQLYHQALSQPREQRAAFLAGACGQDEYLRVEVEGLLAANERAGDFLHSHVASPPKALTEESSSDLSGRKIGHYQVVSQLGKGGMGEVWLVLDTRLGRKVALKCLPAELIGNLERLRRFEQEARTTSALNHPNIITLHEIGEASLGSKTLHFIVTEFIDGETLRQRLGGGRLQTSDLLDFTIQIASALSAAHKAGVVHRDIKPENVMVRRDGIVKVLDFGLAKPSELVTAQFDSESPTIARVETEPGAVIGTARYMSPEQARGEKLDARTDIFSLGVMLYEMTAGKPPFSGVNMIDVLAAILDREPASLSQSGTGVPHELERIIGKALRKDREQRYQSIKDLLIDLNDLKESLHVSAKFGRATGEIEQPSTVRTTPDSRMATLARTKRLGLALTLLLSAAIVIAASVWWFVAKRRETDLPAVTKKVELANWPGASSEIYALGSFSTNGRMFAFAAASTGADGKPLGRSIWLKQKTLSSKGVLVTQDKFDNYNPIWSPNGDDIAYLSLRGSQSGIWRIPCLGGNPELIKPLTSLDAASLKFWSKDGSSIYYELNRNIFSLDVHSKQTTQLTWLDPARVIPYSINISPDRQQVAYITTEKEGRYSLWIEPVSSGSPHRIADLPGPGKRVVWHPDGNRILYSANLDGYFQIFAGYLNRHQPEQITFRETNCFVLDVSADGSEILYSSSKEESSIWAVNLAQAGEFAVASDITFNLWPAVSPDGKTLAFQSIKNVSQADKLFSGSIMIRAIDTAEAEGRQLDLVTNAFLPVWSPDGTQLAFMRMSGSEYSLWTVTTDTKEQKGLKTKDVYPINYDLFPYSRGQANYISWSPNGDRIAYLSDETGQINLRTIRPDGSSDAQLTNNDDPSTLLFCPIWSLDGKRLTYSSRMKKDGRLLYGVWIIDTETKNLKLVRESYSFWRLIGWAAMDKELVLATIPGERGTSLPTEVELIRISVETGAQRSIKKLQAAYLSNIHLSADGKMVAFTSRRDGRDDLWATSVSGGDPKKLTANNDPKLYLSSLVWSSDGQTIYFGKQSRYSLLSMVTNFR